MKYHIDCDTLNTAMVLEVTDEAKFKEAMVITNNFWGDAKFRSDRDGGEVLAGLKLFSQECFQQIAFNNFLDGDYLEYKFDWSKENQGIEGFCDFATAGIKVIDINSWFVEPGEIDISLPK